MSRRRYSDNNSIGEIITPILVFYLFYLLSQYFINRANFWRWLLYGLIFVVILIGGIFGWNEFKYRRKQKKLDNWLSEIKRTGLEGYIQNFIIRFRHEKKKGNWSYRDYYFSWDRLDDFRKFLRDKGIKVSLDNWNDTSLLLKHYIQDREEKLTRESISVPPQKFSNLTARDFEMLIYRLYERTGYSVQHIGGVGDQGGDLIANKGQERLLIQAKRYLVDSSVGNDAVQEAVAAKNHYDCNKAIVVTSGTFTSEARELAKSNNVELISKKELQEMILKYLNENWD